MTSEEAAKIIVGKDRYRAEELLDNIRPLAEDYLFVLAVLRNIDTWSHLEDCPTIAHSAIEAMNQKSL